MDNIIPPVPMFNWRDYIQLAFTDDAKRIKVEGVLDQLSRIPDVQKMIMEAHALGKERISKVFDTYFDYGLDGPLGFSYLKRTVGMEGLDRSTALTMSYSMPGMLLGKADKITIGESNVTSFSARDNAIGLSVDGADIIALKRIDGTYRIPNLQYMLLDELSGLANPNAGPFHETIVSQLQKDMDAWFERRPELKEEFYARWSFDGVKLDGAFSVQRILSDPTIRDRLYHPEKYPDMTVIEHMQVNALRAHLTKVEQSDADRASAIMATYFGDIPRGNYHDFIIKKDGVWSSEVTEGVQGGANILPRITAGLDKLLPTVAAQNSLAQACKAAIGDGDLAEWFAAQRKSGQAQDITISEIEKLRTTTTPGEATCRDKATRVIGS